MNGPTKQRLKAVGRYLLLAAGAALIAGVLFYLSHGWPVAMGLRDRAEKGEVASIQISQGEDMAVLTGPEDLALAAGVAELLSAALPGSSFDGLPEIEYLVTFSDGSQTRVGISGSRMFRDDRIYEPAGDTDSVRLFRQMTEGLFFPDRTVG